MQLKLDDQGHAVLQEGRPVYVHEDGNEVAFDAAGTVATIGRLNGEAKAHRERASAFELRLKSAEGIDDFDAARKALGIVANLDQKKLVDAGEVEKVKSEAIKAVRAEFDPVVKERDQYKTELYNEKIGGSFARSKFVSEKVAVPVHMLQKTYGENFRIEGGKVVAYDGNGSQLFSRVNPGELADFDEALELLIANDPYRDHILKGSQQSGSGAGHGKGQGGKNTMTRTEYEGLSPADQRAAFQAKIKIVD